MARADDLRAEIAVADAEDRLIAAKAKGTTGDKLAAIKDEVRAARQSFREQREAAADGEARPATAKTSATVKKGR